MIRRRPVHLDEIVRHERRKDVDLDDDGVAAEDEVDRARAALGQPPGPAGDQESPPQRGVSDPLDTATVVLGDVASGMQGECGELSRVAARCKTNAKGTKIVCEY